MYSYLQLCEKIRDTMRSRKELRFAFTDGAFRQGAMKFLKEDLAIEILQQCGPIPSFLEWNGKKVLTFGEVAEYYEIAHTSPKEFLKKYEDELKELDGAEILVGRDLADFKALTNRLDPSVAIGRCGVWTPLAIVRLGLLISKPQFLRANMVKLKTIERLGVLESFGKGQWESEWKTLVTPSTPLVLPSQLDSPVVASSLFELEEADEETEEILPSTHPIVRVEDPEDALSSVGDIIKKIKDGSAHVVDISQLQPGVVAIYKVNGPITAERVTDAYLQYRDYGETGVPIQLITTEEITEEARIIAQKLSSDECRIILARLS